MSKLFISNSGLYEPVRYHITDARGNLVSASRKVSGGNYNFGHRDYVNSLHNIVNSYISELNYIESIIKDSEIRFNDTMLEIKNNTDNIEEVKMEERKGITLS